MTTRTGTRPAAALVPSLVRPVPPRTEGTVMPLTRIAPAIPPITREDRAHAAGAAARLLTRLVGAKGGTW
ncbi:hypothetical protein GCM10009760_01670 [Kitasatospora kazusensis]|uniref:Uncharacterized protein n=1 Tax=Kitasatospora kazusensis TaxID=407974 RepID=A0ABN2YPE2_9ACTN